MLHVYYDFPCSCPGEFNCSMYKCLPLHLTRVHFFLCVATTRPSCPCKTRAVCTFKMTKSSFVSYVSCACLSGSLTRPISQILAAINSNMFPVFMAANLATGAINISMRTLDADIPTAIVILATYVTFVAGFAVILANLGLRIKV